MPILYVAGDLFVNTHHAEALAHGCNCAGSMGKGIATGFRDRYPSMYEEYRRRCMAKSRLFNPGDAWLWKEADQPWAFNLGTQEHCWRDKATWGAMGWSLRRLRPAAG